jgi:superfamily II DNA or RNA helicase
MIRLDFVAGTIEIAGLRPDADVLPESALWDPRKTVFRAPAVAYADVVRALVQQQLPYDDNAGQYPKFQASLRIERTPRPYQKESLEKWAAAKGRGVVVLPTGAGKSHVALMAIALKKRSSLVIAPTLDLVRQWYDQLRLAFGVDVGVIGGGEYRIENLTVTTYDSAYIHMEHLGNRFGMVIFDECHHLPGESYSLAAQSCLAPYRLGLTATPERSDGRHALFDDLIGPTVCRRDIIELKGEYLSDYDTIRIATELNIDERESYDTERAIYREFVKSQGISMAQPGGWSEFIFRASQSSAGQRAMKAHRRYRRLAFACQAKLSCIDDLLQQHCNDRTILFTQENATTYAISRRFLIPAITHQTKVSERSEILAGLRSGEYGAVVTAKVLNEGVDVPEANVAIVVSGSGSVREHVQRLGRILRKQKDKRACLYELVTRNTIETYTSAQRRDHSAYR